jgi:hypothetical protein
MVDDGGQGLLRVGLPGDGKADVVHRAQRGIARLQRLMPVDEVACQAVDDPKGIPRGDDRDGRHNRDDQEGVEREGQHRIEERVAERLHDPDEKDRPEDDGPAAARIHSRLQAYR